MAKVEKHTWIVGVGGSETDGVYMERVYGTKKQVEKYLLELVKEDRSKDQDGWEHGTERVNEISSQNNGTYLYAYGCYSDYHIDYVAAMEGEPKTLGKTSVKS